MVNQLKKFLEMSKEPLLKDICDIVSIPSISDDKNYINKAIDKLIEIAKKNDLNFFVFGDKQVLVIEFGEGSETIGILAHVDVVPVQSPKSWRFPPFSGRIFENYIWGRGTIDDKGPLIASLYGILAVKSLNLPLHKKIQLIIGTQEEVNWSDINEYVKENKLPDYGFTPDGEFPITNREKGYLDLKIKFELSEDYFDFGEYSLIAIESGKSINSIPTSAKAVLKGNFDRFKESILNYKSIHFKDNLSFSFKKGVIEVVAKGTSCHSSQPEKGINPIYILTNFLYNLYFSKKSVNSFMNLLYEKLNDDFYGQKFGIPIESDYSGEEFFHKTTVVPTMVKTTKNNIELFLNFRTRFGTKKENIDILINKLSSYYDFKYKYIDYMDPIYINKNKKFITAMARSYEKITNSNCEFKLAHGTSYAKAIPNIVAFGPVFPLEKDYCHEKDERISIESIMKMTLIYSDFLATLATSKESFK